MHRGFPCLKDHYPLAVELIKRIGVRDEGSYIMIIYYFVTIADLISLVHGQSS